MIEMRIPYRHITAEQACWLAEQGYDLSFDADEQVVRILRRWPRDCISSENGDVCMKDVRKEEGV